MKECKKIIAQDEKIVMGVDVHDRKHNVTPINKEMEKYKHRVLQPTAEAWCKYLRKFPECEVTVVCEAGPHGYNLHDLIVALGHRAVVIATEKQGGLKTDERDSEAIARDWLSGKAREVSVPTYEKRVHRQVLRTRDLLMKEITRMKNRLNGIRRFHGKNGGLKAVFRDESGYLDFATELIEEVIGFLAQKVKETEIALGVIAREEAYREQVEALTTITGVGQHTALQVVLGVADVGSFKTSAQFASYLGLCPIERSSGEKRRLGHITRRGPGRIRGALVQCAWSAVRWDKNEKERFRTLSARTGKRKAIVAIARRLAVRMWWTLKNLKDDPPTQTAENAA